MELQISHCFCTQIQKNDFLWREENRDRKNSIPKLKYKYRNREFWCKGYYVDTVGKNEGRIAEYIKYQLEDDRLGEQLRIPKAEKKLK